MQHNLRSWIIGSVLIGLFLGHTGSVGAADATRNSRYWFTHSASPETTTNNNCATLNQAIQQIMAKSGTGTTNGTVDLGFVELPQYFDNNDSVKNPTDAWMEALGFYWRGTIYTGETGGTQDQKLPASKLCKLRKKLAVELIAAMANVDLLGANPSNNVVDKSGTNFPGDLITQAQTVAASQNWTLMTPMTDLLRKFNKSGATINLPAGFVECSATPTKTLRSYSRDATTKLNCPGLNDQCATAEAIIFTGQTNIFATAVYSTKVDLTKYNNTFGSNTCGAVADNGIWLIQPSIGKAGRQFTVDTSKSNVDTIVVVLKGNCGALTYVKCNAYQRDSFSTQTNLTFTTDGTNPYYIVAGAAYPQTGTLKMKVTSP